MGEVSASTEPSGLRNSASAKKVWERLPIVERLYGEHNAKVRESIREVENRMHRYQTGLAPDPTHTVPYKNHPFDEKNRRLQDGNNATLSSSNSGGDSIFKPIRMHFETDALYQMRDRQPNNAAKIDCKYGFCCS